MEANNPTADRSPKPKPKRRWFQYSLRTLLICVTLFAIACSWFAVKMRQAKRQEAAVGELKKLGCSVKYGVEVSRRGYARINKPNVPQWLLNLLGIDFFCHVSHVSEEKGKMTDDAMAHLNGLTHLQSLFLANAQITDAGLENIKDLTQMKIFRIWPDDMILQQPGGVRITDAGLANFKRLTQLIEIHIERAESTVKA